MTSAYSPRPGSKAEMACQLMAAEGPQSRARLASHMDTAQHNIEGILQSAVTAGYVVKVKENGSVRWALADGIEHQSAQSDQSEQSLEMVTEPDVSLIDDGDAPEPQLGFVCSIWSDGELQIVRDGEVITLSAQHTGELLTYLKPFVLVGGEE